MKQVRGFIQLIVDVGPLVGKKLPVHSFWLEEGKRTPLSKSERWKLDPILTRLVNRACNAMEDDLPEDVVLVDA